MFSLNSLKCSSIVLGLIQTLTKCQMHTRRVLCERRLQNKSIDKTGVFRMCGTQSARVGWLGQVQPAPAFFSESKPWTREIAARAVLGTNYLFKIQQVPRLFSSIFLELGLMELDLKHVKSMMNMKIWLFSKSKHQNTIKF